MPQHSPKINEKKTPCASPQSPPPVLLLLQRSTSTMSGFLSRQPYEPRPQQQQQNTATSYLPHRLCPGSPPAPHPISSNGNIYNNNSSGRGTRKFRKQTGAPQEEAFICDDGAKTRSDLRLGFINYNKINSNSQSNRVDGGDGDDVRRCSSSSAPLPPPPQLYSSVVKDASSTTTTTTSGVEGKTKHNQQDQQCYDSNNGGKTRPKSEGYVHLDSSYRVVAAPPSPPPSGPLFSSSSPPSHNLVSKSNSSNNNANSTTSALHQLRPRLSADHHDGDQHHTDAAPTTCVSSFSSLTFPANNNNDNKNNISAGDSAALFLSSHNPRYASDGEDADMVAASIMASLSIPTLEAEVTALAAAAAAAAAVVPLPSDTPSSVNTHHASPRIEKSSVEDKTVSVSHTSSSSVRQSGGSRRSENNTNNINNTPITTDNGLIASSDSLTINEKVSGSSTRARAAGLPTRVDPNVPSSTAAEASPVGVVATSSPSCVQLQKKNNRLSNDSQQQKLLLDSQVVASPSPQISNATLQSVVRRQSLVLDASSSTSPPPPPSLPARETKEEAVELSKSPSLPETAAVVVNNDKHSSMATVTRVEASPSPPLILKKTAPPAVLDPVTEGNKTREGGGANKDASSTVVGKEPRSSAVNTSATTNNNTTTTTRLLPQQTSGTSVQRPTSGALTAQMEMEESKAPPPRSSLEIWREQRNARRSSAPSLSPPDTSLSAPLPATDQKTDAAAAAVAAVVPTISSASNVRGKRQEDNALKKEEAHPSSSSHGKSNPPLKPPHKEDPSPSGDPVTTSVLATPQQPPATTIVIRTSNKGKSHKSDANDLQSSSQQQRSAVQTENVNTKKDNENKKQPKDSRHDTAAVVKEPPHTQQQQESTSYFQEIDEFIARAEALLSPSARTKAVPADELKNKNNKDGVTDTPLPATPSKSDPQHHHVDATSDNTASIVKEAVDKHEDTQSSPPPSAPPSDTTCSALKENIEDAVSHRLSNATTTTSTMAEAESSNSSSVTAAAVGQEPPPGSYSAILYNLRRNSRSAVREELSLPSVSSTAPSLSSIPSAAGGERTQLLTPTSQQTRSASAQMPSPVPTPAAPVPAPAPMPAVPSAVPTQSAVDAPAVVRETTMQRYLRERKEKQQTNNDNNTNTNTASDTVSKDTILEGNGSACNERTTIIGSVGKTNVAQASEISLDTPTPLLASKPQAGGAPPVADHGADMGLPSVIQGANQKPGSGSERPHRASYRDQRPNNNDNSDSSSTKRTLADIPLQELDALERSVEQMLRHYTSAVSPAPNVSPSHLPPSSSSSPTAPAGKSSSETAADIKDKLKSMWPHSKGRPVRGKEDVASPPSLLRHRRPMWDYESDMEPVLDPWDSTTWWCGSRSDPSPPPSCVPPLDLTTLYIPNDDVAQLNYRIPMPTAVRDPAAQHTAMLASLCLSSSEFPPLPHELPSFISRGSTADMHNNNTNYNSVSVSTVSGVGGRSSSKHLSHAFTDDSDALDGGRGHRREEFRKHRVQWLLMDCREQRGRKLIFTKESGAFAELVAAASIANIKVI